MITNLLAMLGIEEIGIILLVLLIGAGLVVGLVLTVMWALHRRAKASAPWPTAEPPPTSLPVIRACPHCGAALNPNSPEGLCPRCVMGVALATPTDASHDSAPHGTIGVEPMPKAADIAQHFPQLEILERLGRGGMGVVYKARQPKLNRLVALKILSPEKGADPKFAERFRREAVVLATLNHPNIVTVHDFGEVDGMFYLLMEFVDGVSLRQLLQRAHLKPEEALALVPKICDALQYAHEQGVVHRDIKPENLLLDKQGRVKIADFGIAKIVAGEPAQQAITQEQVLGTPHYMAPEQIEHPQAVDRRADIYSLGVVFYEMLTGELPLGKFLPPSNKVQVDVRLDEVVLRALAKEPERRYQQARDVKTDVETIINTPAPADGLAPASMSSAPDARARAEALRRVNLPAIGLFAAGTLDFASVAAVLGSQLFLEGRQTVSVLVLPLLFVAGVIMVGAYQMRRLTSHRLALVASVLGMIIPLGALVGLPFGIWSLVVLNQPDVRAAFARPQAPTRWSWLALGRSITRRKLAWVVAPSCLLLTLAITWWMHRPTVGTPGASPANPAFGPEIEQSLGSLDGNARDRFLDLDQGRIIPSPSQYSIWSRERKHQWLRQNGVDLMVLGNALQPWNLLTPVDNETKLTRVPADSWERGVDADFSDSEPEQRERLQFVDQDVELLQLRLDDRPTLPDHTFAFYTANGARGLLKVSAVEFGRGDEIVGLRLIFKRAIGQRK